MGLDLGDDPSRSAPSGGLILETPIADQRRVARSATGPSEQILDAPLQDIVSRESDRVPHPSPFQGFIEGGQGKRRVGTDDHRPALRAVPVNDGKQDLVPPVRTVDVARPELGREAVALRIEHEEGEDSRRIQSGRGPRAALAPQVPGSRSCRYRASPSGSLNGLPHTGSVPC
jgi:hypothetical protein